MASTHPAHTWRIADLTFIELELRHPTDSQMRIDFTCGTRLIITDRSQIPVAVELIETLRTRTTQKGAQS